MQQLNSTQRGIPPLTAAKWAGFGVIVPGLAATSIAGGAKVLGAPVNPLKVGLKAGAVGGLVLGESMLLSNVSLSSNRWASSFEGMGIGAAVGGATYAGIEAIVRDGALSKTGRTMLGSRTAAAAGIGLAVGAIAGTVLAGHNLIGQKAGG